MIRGNRIKLRLFKDEEEVRQKALRFNNLENRLKTDHTEIYAPIKSLEAFRNNGCWSQKEGTLVITTLEDKVIGTISYHHSTEFELAVGYRMEDTLEQGKGYMTEALTLFTKYLFETIPLVTRIALYTAEDNLPSRKLAEKCGYTQEGILRNAYFYRGHMHNWVIYSMLREEV